MHFFRPLRAILAAGATTVAVEKNLMSRLSGFGSGMRPIN